MSHPVAALNDSISTARGEDIQIDIDGPEPSV